ncbi:MAG: acetyl-CoA hydrolase/transferase C-terminal domain-containing protein [Anaerolineaceae bacterium]|nr:acetyl-CoA hydrolase/transferase C-terminal domain-containing protein [Anaerolineaceae bacterium]
MTLKYDFQGKLITIQEAVNKIQSGDRIGLAIAASEPCGLLSELAKQKDRLEDVHTWVCLPMRAYEYAINPDMDGHFFVENWFYGAFDRKTHSQGRMSYIPNNLHRAASDKLYATGGKLNVFWGTATPPDDRGYMSLSLSLVVEKELMQAADLVILEINENLPWTLGDTQIHLSEVDFVVENHVPLYELPATQPTETEQKIGEFIAELIEDGATLQLGIGGIPNAITHFLKNHKDLGIHTEMFNDGMVDLYESGAITNRKKTIYKGKMVGAFALGTKKLYDFINNNIGVEFLQGKTTNNPYVIGQNYKMISVNTALQVDIFGQVCSQSIGYKHFSGTGGQLDTHRGAQLSQGGRGIIALRSTAKDGEISTIVSTLSLGAEVTVPSQCVDTIVTEFGIAELRGRNLMERAKALIQIAHPEMREPLAAEVRKLGIVPSL